MFQRCATAGLRTLAYRRLERIPLTFAVFLVAYLTSDPTAAAEPPPGYEPRQIRAGGFTISPEVDLSVTGDSNVFATSQNADDDVYYRLAPRVPVERAIGSGGFTGEVHGDFRRFSEHKRENVDLYGGNAALRYPINRGSAVNVGIAYDRTFERRDDPESSNNLALPPVNIDVVSGEAGYQYRAGRLGVTGTFGVTKIDYLDDRDSDRDMETHRAAVRGLLGISSRFDLFAEGYGNLRDFKLSQDRSGVNRDATTLGANIGTRIAIANLWTGEIGVGPFHVDPTDASLESFSGIGANASVTWRPSERTSVTGSLFSGDVATVRQGATGRIDTRARLEIEQEARQNLFLHAAVGYLDVSYREARDQSQKTFVAEAGLEYFISRSIALTVDILYAQRNATNALDDFERVQFVIGPRFRL